MPLIATPKATDANAYCDVDFADAYFATRLGADAWTDVLLSESQKEAAIITATARLEEREYIGVVTDVAQALKWPRSFVTKRMTPFVYYDKDTIPDRVKQACCEMALALVMMPTQGSDFGLEQLDSLTVGGDTFTVNKRGEWAIPAQVRRLLQPVLDQVTIRA